jgi:hypothetical protein
MKRSFLRKAAMITVVCIAVTPVVVVFLATLESHFGASDLVTKSLRNGKTVALACKQYASEHGGDFPPSLDSLCPKYLNRKALISPLNPSEPFGYTYFPGQRKTDKPEAVLFEDKFAPALFHCDILFFTDAGGLRFPSIEEPELYYRFEAIRDAIEDFSYDHAGRLPSKLADLSPQYISADHLSNCVYLGAAGLPRELIAYEDESPSNSGLNKRWILEPSRAMEAVSRSELNQLLSGRESALLERLRQDRVVGYESDMHGCLNLYRCQFGDYPTGDNAAVLRALLGHNPAKEWFNAASYKGERNAQGEDVDPWGTPYRIESDGHTVRMKSAGPNRRFDQPGTPGDDDICYTISNGGPLGNSEKF